MRVHVIYNNGQERLYRDHFLTSIKDGSWRVFPTYCFGDGGDCVTEKWMEVILFKVENLVRIIRDERALGTEYFILSDIDIQFFKPCTETIEREMIGRDIIFQSENGTDKPALNTGFMVMRPTIKVQAYWQAVLEQLRKNVSGGLRINDQDINNTAIHTSGLIWGKLPNTFWCWNNPTCGPNSCLIKEIHMHHANGTWAKDGKSSLQLKLEQLELVKKAVLG